MDNELGITVKAKDQASSTLKGVERNIRGTSDAAQDSSKNLKIAATAIAAVGVGLTIYAKNATDATVTYVKGVTAISRVTGETITETSRLQYAFQRTGIDAANTAQVFGIFSKQIVKASDDTKYTDTALGKLGVTVRDNQGRMRGFSDVLLDVSDKFKSMPDGAEKSSLAVDLFGRSGRNLIPILNKGSEGIRDLEAQADKLGLTITTKNVAAVQKYVNSQKDLKDSTMALKLAVGTLTAPVLADFNNRINSVYTTILKTDGPLKTATVNILAFGGPILTATAGFIGFAANLRTAIGGINIFSKAVTLARAAMGPWGIALTAVATALTIGIGWIWKHTSATNTNTDATSQQVSVEEELNQQLEDNQRNTDNVTQSTKALSDARFAMEGDSLAVERAERSYTDAVKEYGSTSLEARQASHDLQAARESLRESTEKANLAEDNLNLAEGRLSSSTPAVLEGISLRVDKFAGLVGTISNAISQVQTLDNVTAVVAPKIQGSISNVQGSVVNLQSQVTKLQASSATIQGGGNRSLQGGRAAGGPVRAGMAYPVGENADGTFNKTTEIFVPGTNGTIVDAKTTQGLAGAGNKVEINVSLGYFLGTESELRSFGVRLSKLVNQAMQGQGVNDVNMLR